MPARHILLVEDDPDLVSMLTEVLVPELRREAGELLARIRDELRALRDGG